MAMANDMSDVLIDTIGSYQCLDRVRDFINAAFQMDPTLLGSISGCTRTRLVVIKPNWVQEAHEHVPAVWEPLITHPNLVIAVVESLAEKMEGQGTICICDAPHAYASFQSILSRGGLEARILDVRRRWPNLNIEVLDLRREVWTRREEVVVNRRRNGEDPRGYVRLNLGKDSLFYGHRGEGRYYGADYDSRVVNDHHRGETQEYLLSGTAIACDLFINLPKMKTHKKTGISCCLKNLVGVNADKNWLPHHTEGSPEKGGDEFPQQSLANSTEGILKQVGRQMILHIPTAGSWVYRKMRNAGKSILGDSATVIRNGNWAGNDTCWRMTLDLNRALLYGNCDGTWRDRRQPKAYLAIVDGIIGGQGNGPLCPDPVPSNVLVAGTTPGHIDAVVAMLMGFDPHRIPMIERAFEPHRWPIAMSGRMNEIIVLDRHLKRRVVLPELAPAVKGGFVPHFGWNDIRNTEV
jgi:uncharacterized protein (DUF362 family)